MGGVGREGREWGCRLTGYEIGIVIIITHSFCVACRHVHQRFCVFCCCHI